MRDAQTGAGKVRRKSDEADKDMPMLTRTVTCPSCRAEAMLTYTQRDDGWRRARRDNIVYMCPNMCALRPRQFLALLGSGQ